MKAEGRGRFKQSRVGGGRIVVVHVIEGEPGTDAEPHPAGADCRRGGLEQLDDEADPVGDAAAVAVGA